MHSVDITLDESLIIELPLLRCLEFLYTGNVLLETNSVLLDETVVVAECFDMPELMKICQSIKLKVAMSIPVDNVKDVHCTTTVNFAKAMFFNQPRLSDVILKVGRKNIPVHKVVLQARCEVLSAMFSEGFMEGEASVVKMQYSLYMKRVCTPILVCLGLFIPQVELHGATYQCVLAFIKYLYTDSCKVKSIKNAVDLLILSDQYMMPRLMALCEKFIATEIERRAKNGIDKSDIDVICKCCSCN